MRYEPKVKKGIQFKSKKHQLVFVALLKRAIKEHYTWSILLKNWNEFDCKGICFNLNNTYFKSPFRDDIMPGEIRGYLEAISGLHTGHYWWDEEIHYKCGLYWNFPRRRWIKKVIKAYDI